MDCQVARNRNPNHAFLQTAGTLGNASQSLNNWEGIGEAAGPWGILEEKAHHTLNPPPIFISHTFCVKPQITPGSKYHCYFQFTDEETEAQNDSVTYPRSHSQ